jgi:AAHS family benzoate transporter-like MFS transporter
VPPLEPYGGKPVALMAASVSAYGGVRGLGHLRAIFGKLGATVLGEEVALPLAERLRSRGHACRADGKGNAGGVRLVLGLYRGWRAGRADPFYPEVRPGAEGAPTARLFQDGRGFSTAMFWVAFFMCLFMVYALSSWLTKLMASAGFSLGSALAFVLVLNLGGVVGAVGGGWLADRFHIKHVLVGMYALAAVSITLLGYQVPVEALYLLVGLAGASTIGTQIVTFAYAGQFYPMPVRSTGIGWASGIGRSGAILAPIVIGTLVGLALPLQQNFLAIAIPAVIAALAVSLIKHDRSASWRDKQAGSLVREAATVPK